MADISAGEPQLHAEVIVPVPVHHRRLRERGYNQAGLLAREIARRGAGCLDETLLVRVRDTRSQTELNREERAMNVWTAFDVTRSLDIRRVLLVDDVLSTGATANACARALARAGVRETAVVVAAMAVPEMMGMQR